jgi:glycosyltransferase involved in cell wall biosynthesis
MALGKTVVTFHERILPILGAKNNYNIIGVSNKNEMIEKINNLTQSDLIRIGENARKLIFENYTWESIKAKLQGFMDIGDNY